MYKYINEHRIEKYDGQILKEYDNDRLVKVVANPTEQDLRKFGYKHFQPTEAPEAEEGYYFSPRYIDGETITQEWVKEVIVNEEGDL